MDTMMNEVTGPISSTWSSSPGWDMSTSETSSQTVTPVTAIDVLVSTTIPPKIDNQLSVVYTASEILVAVLAIFGNALVVHVFCTTRSLRRYRNYYIVALAIADFLVGLLGIPCAVMAKVGFPPGNLYGCLMSLSILMVLCTVSILCLVAVSVDRYWATTNPFAYYRNMTTTTSVGIILSCWVLGTLIGFLPLVGWYNEAGWEKAGQKCFFLDIMEYSYLVFLYFSTIVFPAVLMAGFYGYIYHVVLIKIRQKGALTPQGRRTSEHSRSGSLNSDNPNSTQMMRIVVSEKRREAKAAKKLGIIVLFFMICWMPLYTINCIQAFCRECKIETYILDFTIILSHANSAINPFLYAYHLKEFRLAMKNSLLSLFGFICCGYCKGQDQKSPVGHVSRSQTVPSLANASLSTQTGKISIKFRKVTSSEDRTRRSAQVGGGVLATVSRDNLLRTFQNDKSLTSLSIGSDTSSAGAGGGHGSVVRFDPDLESSAYFEKNGIAMKLCRSKSENVLDNPTRTLKTENTTKKYVSGSAAASNGNKATQHAILETDVESCKPPVALATPDTSDDLDLSITDPLDANGIVEEGKSIPESPENSTN